MAGTVAGYILAGGENRRMGGRKKVFLEYEGKAFYEYICGAFEKAAKISDELSPEIYLSVENATPYQALLKRQRLNEDEQLTGESPRHSLRLIADKYIGIGPMGGIATGLETCAEDALFVMACDMPCVSADIICKLMAAYHENHGVVAAKGASIHPLCGIYPKTVLPLMKSMIAEQNYRMSDFVKRAGGVVVNIEDEQLLKNVNTPNEYLSLHFVDFVNT